jgi:hypothetical protein
MNSAARFLVSFSPLAVREFISNIHLGIRLMMVLYYKYSGIIATPMSNFAFDFAVYYQGIQLDIFVVHFIES